MSDPQRPSDDDDKTVEQPAVEADETAKKPAEPETPAAAHTGPPPVPPAPPAKGGFRRFAGHRATQLVAVGVLGFVIGGGVIGTAVGLAAHHGDRPGFSRGHHGSAGPGGYRDFRDGHGDRGWRDEYHGR
ncbi:hypothetical protein SD37_40655 [Amycolatopsis orientalis]|uniref:Uncharacterized protein n=1 Tax=Amycolatopsis orientalis TaxID=31958 RepID=A0A193C9Z4_AMYOR|nr:hypothetical protein [Amycolatopsis orientalis]ANN21269.1 hypothetical protein SD37_40655 [Amycolatopsis orientalis]